VLAQTLGWVLRPGRFMERCQRRYGDCFTVRLLGFGDRGPAGIVFLADPAAAKATFAGDRSLNRVGESRQSMAPMFGSRSILLLDGAEHMRQRKLMLPPFHGERMARYGKLIEEIADREVDSWPSGRVMPLQPRFQAITLEVIFRAVFGLDEAASTDELRGRVKALLEMVANPLSELAMGLPGRIGPINIRAGFERAVASADELLIAEIRRRRDDPTLAEREDILSLLLQARDEDGEPMTDREVRDELVTLLLAGHETTATALAWAFEHLFRRPEALARLTDECSRGDDDSYLDAVVKETLRLRPPVPLVDRTLSQPLDLGEHVLPAGTTVAPCIYLIHRRPDLYPEPHAFRPERFLDNAPETYGWLPFGGGTRRCVGASFATFEMKTVMRRVLQRARLRPAGSRPEAARRRAIVLAPSRGARAILQ
jgi:cytochrome P450